MFKKITIKKNQPLVILPQHLVQIQRNLAEAKPLWERIDKWRMEYKTNRVSRVSNKETR